MTKYMASHVHSFLPRILISLPPPKLLLPRFFFLFSFLLQLSCILLSFLLQLSCILFSFLRSSLCISFNLFLSSFQFSLLRSSSDLSFFFLLYLSLSLSFLYGKILKYLLLYLFQTYHIQFIHLPLC